MSKPQVNHDARKALGDRIAHERMRKGWSLRELARRVTELQSDESNIVTSVAPGTIAAWEKAANIPQPAHARALAKALRISFTKMANLVIAAKDERRAAYREAVESG